MKPIHRLARRLLRGGSLWSIGVCRGESPLSLHDCGPVPVLTTSDITDRRARYVADPFLAFHEGRWHMFFEILLDEGKPKGVIGLATNPDTVRWTYEGIVLEEPFHLSYPYLFTCQDRHYMVPESREAGEVRLYKAEHFPRSWRHCASLIRRPLADASLFRHAGLWWLLAEDIDPPCSLVLYHAAELEGSWTEHPRSPVVSANPRVGRPAGRILLDQGRLYRFAQDRLPHYGARVHALEITALTQDDYAEQLHTQALLEGSGRGWNALGMHHIDLHRLEGGEWLAAVDGRAWQYFLLGRWRLPGWSHPLLAHLHLRLLGRGRG